MTGTSRSDIPDAEGPDKRPELVRTMFDGIAPVYDFLNHFLSLGIDILWRRRLARELNLKSGALVLDLASGTGDQAGAIMNFYKDCSVYAMDFSPQMLALSGKKFAGFRERLFLVKGDALKIPFPDNTFSAISISFGVRNLADISGGLLEMKRVIEPGGEIAILEFSMPRNRLFSRLYRFYLYYLVPIFGMIISGQKAYYYLRDSIKAFPSADEFVSAAENAGLKKKHVRPLTFGIAYLYIFSA